MCGINGAISFNNNMTEQYLGKIVHGMNEKIIHRGPNSEGLYSDDKCSLGMRRLSIIDINGGEQPIWNEAHDKLIVFNGEIYNYQELKESLIAKGHVFKTHTDTEVVLHSYEEYGKLSFKMLEGMFAFCIYDLLQKEWLIVRDKNGEKPLYYYKNDDLLLFASELKSILGTGVVPKNINKDALDIYFQLGYIPAPYSIVSNVYKLQPASYMKIKYNGVTQVDKYWELQITPPKDEDVDYESSKKKLRELVLSSVSRRMHSDVSLGAFLSGGIDSAVIVGTMSSLSTQKIDTFTIGFKEKEYDERYLAEIVANKYQTNHHVLELDWGEAINNLDDVFENMDEPFADPSYIASYTVSKLAKKYVTVVLTGDAGDEVFAGYEKYLIGYYSKMYQQLPVLARKRVIEPGIRLLPLNSVFRRKAEKVMAVSSKDIFEQRKQMMTLVFRHDEAERLIQSKPVNNLEFIKQYYDKWSNIDEQICAQYMDLKVVLEGDMLCKVDRASMLASIETRVPFVDTDIVEFAFNLPSNFKINKSKKKIILKDAFRDIIPKEIVGASKKGFGVPVGEWLKSDLKDEFIKYLEDSFLENQRLFTGQYIKDVWMEHLMGKKNNSTQIWAFFVFQKWYERYILG